MKATLESTSKVVLVDGVPARVWEGTTERGQAIAIFVASAVELDGDPEEFDRDLAESRSPSRDASMLGNVRTWRGSGQPPIDMRPVPNWMLERLQPLFAVPLRQILANPAPSRGGMDAWTWVENGHSWYEVANLLERGVLAEAP